MRRLWSRLLHLFGLHRWRTVRDTGVNVYQQCECGKRRVWLGDGGYQAIDVYWVLTGEWRSDVSFVRSPAK